MKLVVRLLLTCALIAYATAYSIDTNMTGTTFFDNWNFFNGNDPTHGYVNFVDRQTAQNEGLISAEQWKIIIGSDNKNIASGRGRNSIRLTSNKSWKNGLFILDAIHMPTGCGTWPAWWLVGPNWPNGGEIDVVEGVNNQGIVQTTLHTSDGCIINDPGNAFSGHWGTGTNGNPTTNCYVNAPNQYANQGCGIIGGENSMGDGFNNQGGGVYAIEKTDNFIRAFFWPRHGLPSNVLVGNPDPNSWGQPYAYFALGGACPNWHFSEMNLIFDLTFCGDWAGSVFGQMCPGKGDCNDFVKNNPGAFDEAYWWVQQVLVYE